MSIKPSTKLADAIHSNYMLLPVLNRFGINLGFGDRTVEQICSEHKINQQFFLEIVNSYMEKDYFPQSGLQSFPLKFIVEYINQSHIYYLNYKIPHIEKIIGRLIDEGNPENKNAHLLIQKFFREYISELTEHIEKEEKEVHPYILMIDKAVQDNVNTPELKDIVRKKSIDHYAKEHDNVEDKLFDLKNLIIKYLPPSNDYTLSNAILFELFRLEHDLNDHARIEEKVLVPKVQQVEKQILGNK
jgi:regulator of cell morphogenesis and NO signaling